MAHVVGGGLQRSELAFGRFEIQRGCLRLEALRRDAVDRAAACLIGVLMAAGALVIPVADVDRAIRAHADIAGAEKRLALVAHVVLAADEVAAFEHAARVGRAEIESLEFEARAVRFGQIAEDDIAAGFATEQQTAPFFAQRAVFDEAEARGSTAAIHITGRDAARIVLTPLRLGNRLSGTLVRTPLTLSIA